MDALVYKLTFKTVSFSLRPQAEGENYLFLAFYPPHDLDVALAAPVAPAPPPVVEVEQLSEEEEADGSELNGDIEMQMFS